jgi:hypothetical protein
MKTSIFPSTLAAQPSTPAPLTVAAAIPASPQPDNSNSERGPILAEISDESWELLFKRTEKFARGEIKRRRWRSAKRGGLPGGYDANSIAAQALTELWQARDQQSAPLASPPRTSPAPNRKPVEDKRVPQLLRDLQLRVRRLVNRLRHRRENYLFRDEFVLAPVVTDDGEKLGIIEAASTPDASPLQVLICKEEGCRWEDVKAQFISFVGPDQVLKDLFACLCAGILKRAAIAGRLKLSPSAITSAQKRLERRLVKFSHRKII